MIVGVFMGEFTTKTKKYLKAFLNIISFGLFSRKNRDKSYDLFGFSDEAKKANSLCEELLDTGKKKLILLKELQELSKRESELEKFKKLTEEDIKRIRKLLFDHKAIVDEREALKGRLISRNRILSTIQKYEEDFPDIIKEIEEAEDKQRRVKMDIDYLTGEKEALIYSKEQLELAKEFIDRLSVGIVILFGLVALIFTYIFIAKESNIFFPLSITAICVMLVGTITYFFKRRVVFEINKNGLMQAKVVKLLNGAKIRYVYYTNFLDYEYNKYNVDSTEQLQRSWELYMKNKHHEKRYNNINIRMNQIEEEVMGILKDRGINVNYFEDIKHWSRIEERKNVLDNIQKEKSILESKLNYLDQYQEEIWAQLEELKENDETEDKTIEKIINRYLEEDKITNP